MVDTPDEGDLTRRATRQTRPVSDAPSTSQNTAAISTDSEPHVELSSARLQQFKSILQQLFRKERTQSLSMVKVEEHVNNEVTEKYSKSEIKQAVDIMTNENQVMLADDILFLI